MAKHLGSPKSIARGIGGSVFLFVASAWGCGGDSPSQNDGGVMIGNVASFHDAGADGGDADVFLCTLPTPCAYVYYTMGDGLNFSRCQTGHVDNVNAAHCILRKLRDREVSALQVTVMTPLCNKRYLFTDEVLFVLDGEHGASSDHVTAGSFEDPHHVPWSSSGTSSLQKLQPPSYFEACLSQTDVDKMMYCITQPWSKSTDLPPTCPH